MGHNTSTRSPIARSPSTAQDGGGGGLRRQNGVRRRSRDSFVRRRTRPPLTARCSRRTCDARPRVAFLRLGPGLQHEATLVLRLAQLRSGRAGCRWGAVSPAARRKGAALNGALRPKRRALHSLHLNLGAAFTSGTALRFAGSLTRAAARFLRLSSSSFASCGRQANAYRPHNQAAMWCVGGRCVAALTRAWTEKAKRALLLPGLSWENSSRFSSKSRTHVVLVTHCQAPSPKKTHRT